MNYIIKTPFMELYEELSEINSSRYISSKHLLEAFSDTPKQMQQVTGGHKWPDSSMINTVEEAFDNEEVYGEAAKTIPGLLRYFVADINVMADIIERGRILASAGESKSADPGKTYGKKLPFVSFSHQLFSHAYRRNSVWKYGVVLDQNKLEQKIQTMLGTDIEDNFVHKNRNSNVFGAAKLANGAEIIIDTPLELLKYV